MNERWGEIYGATGPPKPRAVVNDKEVQALTLETLARSSAQACAGAAPAAVPASVRKSQSQEDEHLLSFFGGFCGGTYVELGALNGITFSNTYAFNKALGWKGVLIELSPTTFARLRANRPDELAVVNSAVCKEEGMVHYVDNPKGQAVNGIWELASPKFRDLWWRGKTIDDTTPVRCRPLRSILGEVSDAERDRRFLRAQSRREIGCPPSPVDICCRDSFIPTFTGTHTRVDRSFICRQVLSSRPSHTKVARPLADTQPSPSVPSHPGAGPLLRRLPLPRRGGR